MPKPTAQAIARVKTIALVGIEPADVDVEVQLASGLPSFSIVGLPDKAVAESRDRVRAALSTLNLALPPRRITINLAPGDLAKEGSHYDLPIALGLLIVMGVLPADAVAETIVLGELGLDATIRGVPGVLAAAIAASEQQLALICPSASGREAAWLGDSIEIMAASDLLTLINHVRGDQVMSAPERGEVEDYETVADLRDVKGQETAKRALEIAAAGRHNLLMVGPPGAGKSMLASRMIGLLPQLTAAEALELGLIRSVGGRLVNGSLSRNRPFRSPHHAASMAAMVGGGSNARPGEISLAHGGILFLDELPEFSRQVLESLRQPLESGAITVARANNHVTYPARVQLVAAMNPCRCGHLDDPALACGKAPRCAGDYQKRISGPLIDRFDLHIEVPAVMPRDLRLPVPSEGTADVAARVAAAHQTQHERFAGLGEKTVRLNAEADGELLDRIAEMSSAAADLLVRASERMRLSARGYHRVIRVARTIADLAGAGAIEKPHIAEALSFRRQRA